MPQTPLIAAPTRISIPPDIIETIAAVYDSASQRWSSASHSSDTRLALLRFDVSPPSGNAEASCHQVFVKEAWLVDDDYCFDGERGFMLIRAVVRD